MMALVVVSGAFPEVQLRQSVQSVLRAPVQVMTGAWGHCYVAVLTFPPRSVMVSVTVCGLRALRGGPRSGAGHCCHWEHRG